MNGIIERLKKILIENGYSCVIRQNNDFYMENEKGIAPIANHYEMGHLKGACIADKVIGKASAMYVIAGEAKEVYGEVMSKPAMEILNKHDVKYQYEELVENIINREKNGLCPMESSVLEEDDIQIGLQKINDKRISLQKK